MPRIVVNGSVLAYEIHGRADRHATLVLLHGLGSCAADWQPQVDVFASTHTVIAVDLANHGASRSARRLPTMETMAADVEGLLAALDLGAVHVMGLSIGGCVALALALRAPARVRSLVLVNAFARFQPAGAAAAVSLLVRLALVLGAPMSRLALHVACRLFPRPEQEGLRSAAAARLATNGRWAYLVTMAAIVRFDARRRLGEIRCPTLVIAGDRDTTIPLTAKQRLTRGIPDARLIVVADSGHVTNWDQPAMFNRIVGEFLTGR